MTKKQDNIIVRETFMDEELTELSPERDAGTAICHSCKSTVRIWMRGWLITKQTACKCSGGCSMALSFPQSALKKD